MDRGKALRLAALLAGLVLQTLAVFLCNLAKAEGDMVQIVLEQSVDAAAAEEIFRWESAAEEPVGCCFWGERAAQTLSCRETGGSAQVTEVFLSGNPELMGAGCLNWQEGCLIDRGTARTLFGTTLCGRQFLWHDGKSYRVLGTVSALRPTLITMAKAGDRLNRCVLALPAEKGKPLAEQFLTRWGLGGKVLDFYPLLALTENLLLLFPGILLLRACSCLGKDWRKRSNQLPLPGRTALALGLAGAALWLLAKGLVIPGDMIPSRWSDFSFWGTWWESRKENFLRILFTPPGSMQLQMLLDMVKSMGASTASGILTLWAVRRRRNADIADRG